MRIRGGGAWIGLIVLLTAPGPWGSAEAQEREGGGPAPTRIGPPVRLSVEDAVGRATVENEEVLVARAERARSQGLVTEVRARSLPEVNLNFGYTRNLQTPVLFFNNPETGTQQISIGEANDYAFSLSLEQPVLDFSLGPARTAARLSRVASEASVEAARVEVAREVRVAYYQVLLDRALVRVQEQALEQARARLRQVEGFRGAGTASEFDLLTAQVEVDNVRPQLIEARNRLALDRNRLKRVVGLPLEAQLVLTDSLTVPEDGAPTLDQALARATEDRADLRGQEVRVRLQRESLIAESRAALPTLSLTASFLRRASSSDFLPPERDFSQSASAGLALEIPLFDGRARAGRVQQAEAQMAGERYRLRQLREQVRLEVQQAHQNLQAALEQIDASSATVRRAERALGIAQTRFQNGLATQVELNDAELAVTRARTNRAQALYSYHAAWATLLRAQGRR